MDSAKWIERMLEYQKAAFDASYNTMVISEGQAVKFSSDMWNKALLPKDIWIGFDEMISEYRKSRDNLKKLADNAYAKLTESFNSDLHS
jgi:hypothetical protein